MDAYRPFSNQQQDLGRSADSPFQGASSRDVQQEIIASPGNLGFETFMNTDLLAFTVDKLAKAMDVSNIDKNAVLYLALATQQRLQEFLKRVVEASRHRVASQTVDPPPLDETDQPVYKVSDVQDIRKQLLAIERVEREEERKRREAIAERERNANVSDGGEGGDGEDDAGNGTAKKKKKKKKELGPSMTARNMSEDISKKSTNETALMSAGGIRKSWMLTGMGGGKDLSTPSSLSSSSLTSSSAPVLASTIPASSAATMSLSPNPTASTPFMNRTHLSLDDMASPTVIKSELPTDETATRGGRGRPRGRKSEGTKRSRNQSSVKRDRSQDVFLSSSMLGRHQHRIGEQPARKLTVIDAMYALERELDSGVESGRRALIKSYNKYLK